MDQELAEFDIEGTRFLVQKVLLGYLNPSWELIPGVNLAKENLYTVPNTSGWAFRGFMLWLYNNQQLPTEDMLNRMGYPEGSDVGTERGPLLCRMAIELNHIGETLQMEALMNMTINHIFHEYQSQYILPDFSRLWQTFRCGPNMREQRLGYVCLLFNDLCLKREDLFSRMIKQHVSTDPNKRLPPDFLQGLSGSDLMYKNQGNPPSRTQLYLGHYHWHREDNPDCACKSAHKCFIYR